VFVVPRVSFPPSTRIHYESPQNGSGVLKNVSKFNSELLKRLIAPWPAPGSEDTELGVLMEPEVDHGAAEVYPRVQA
jgi:hypothetical protein